MNIWKAQNKPIVVGMRLDDHENLLFQSAMSLAKKLQSCVELVHCFELPIGYSSAGEILPKASSQSQTFNNPWSEDRAKVMLKALGHSAKVPVEVHVHVERGDAAETLSRVAREVGAGLIVCGMHDERPPGAFKGVSTALSLAFYAPIPVLVLPMSIAIDFEKPGSILICDSLGGEGWYVLESGLQLARFLDCKAAYHAHILKANAFDIEIALHDMSENATQGRLTQDVKLRPEVLEKTLLQKINEELSYRFHNTSCSKDLTNRYHPIAGIGDVDAEVNRIMKESGAHLVIMGRHQFYSNRRLALDHIPYQAIKDRKAGLLVIPNYEEARLRVQDEWESRFNGDKDMSDMPQTAHRNQAKL